MKYRVKLSGRIIDPEPGSILYLTSEEFEEFIKFGLIEEVKSQSLAQEIRKIMDRPYMQYRATDVKEIIDLVLTRFDEGAKKEIQRLRDEHFFGEDSLKDISKSYARIRSSMQ